MALKTQLPEDVDRRLYDGVTFTRGWGDTGRRLELVHSTCDKCNHEKMLRFTRVNAETQNEVEEKCMLPNCPNYHDGEWDYFFL